MCVCVCVFVHLQCEDGEKKTNRRKEDGIKMVWKLTGTEIIPLGLTLSSTRICLH